MPDPDFSMLGESGGGSRAPRRYLLAPGLGDHGATENNFNYSAWLRRLSLELLLKIS